MSPEAVVGLDLGRTRLDGIRLVCGQPNEDHSFYCLGWRRFVSRERFQHYWLRHLDHLQPRVAAYGSDFLDVVKWLERLGVLVERPAPTDRDRDLEGEMYLWMLPRPYLRAYDMALSANLRVRRDQVMGDQWLRLNVLSHALAQITEDLRRLDVTLDFGSPDPAQTLPAHTPETPPTDPDEYDAIPF